MTWKNLIFVLALVPAIVGCGPDCESLCEDGNECDGKKDVANCEDYCEDLEELVEKADCEDSYDEVLDCADDSDDICDENQCNSEILAYTGCMSSYCSTHASECVVN